MPFFDRAEALPSSPISPVPLPLSLSFAQEIMLFWDKLVPHSPVYNVPFAFVIQGTLDTKALTNSLDLILSRHEVLRSRFLFHRGEPTIALDPPAKVPLRVVDLSYLSASERTSAVQHAANAEARRPFTLAADLMLRAALLRVSPAEHILVLTLHHIAADGWSVGVLLKELSQAYAAFATGSKPSLPLLRVQYSHFATWQRELLRSNDAAERCLAFWKQQLSGFASSSDCLPLDHVRPAQQTFGGEMLRTYLPASTLTDLVAVGQMRRASAFMVMLAALQALLHLHSDAPEVAVGVPVANRARSEFEDLIGCFINMVVVRGALSGNLTFLELLGRTRENALSAFLHPEVPFCELVRHLHPKRSMNRTPWFQVQLVFQSYPMPEMNWPGLTVRRYDVDTATSKFDLSVLIESKGDLEIAFEYNTDLFDSSTMHRMLNEYASLLQRIVKRPDTRLRELGVRALVC